MIHSLWDVSKILRNKSVCSVIVSLLILFVLFCFDLMQDLAFIFMGCFKIFETIQFIL